MGLLETLALAAGLSMDAFAVAVAAGGSGRANGVRAAIRLSFHFGLFQAMMPIAGWYLGSRVADRIASVDHWIALLLLSIVGLRMIRSGLDPEGRLPADPSRGVTLVTLSLATSVDALAVGITLAMLGLRIWLPSAIIGITAAAFTIAGLRLGARLGVRFGKRMEVAGGAVLIGIGVKILLFHLFH